MPMSNEQLEAYGIDAVEKLVEKIGPGAQVIVMVADMNSPNNPYYVARRGFPLGLLWLLRACSRIVENYILPTPTVLTEKNP